MAPYLRPTRANEPAPRAAQRTTAIGHRALTQSTRAVTKSVAAVADVLRSANRPAFAEGLMPSRLRRWWWKAGDLAWNCVGAVGALATIVVVAFVAYVLISIVAAALFG